MDPSCSRLRCDSQCRKQASREARFLEGGRAPVVLRKVPLSLETKRFSAPARSTAGAVCPAPTPRPVPPPTALPPRKQSYPLKTQIRSSASKTTTEYSASPPNRCVPSAPAHEAAATRASRQLHRWAKTHPCSGALCLRLRPLTMLFPRISAGPSPSPSHRAPP